MDGLSLTIGGSLGAAIVAAIVKIYTANKHSESVKLLADKSRVPQPCDVHLNQDCVSVKECNRRMKALEERMDKMDQRVSTGFDNILKKLDAMDSRSEERAIALNRRMDPIIEKVAANSAKIDTFEQLARQATVGGK